MSFDSFFKNQIEKLKSEGNYRYFADLERQVDKFPLATNHFEGGKREVKVWCSNDYLGMGQHPKVIAAMQEAVGRCGAGAGGIDPPPPPEWTRRPSARSMGRPGRGTLGVGSGGGGGS